MTHEELVEVEQRNDHRRKLKSKVTPGPWLHDDCGFIDALLEDESFRHLPRDRRMGILVRPRAWFDGLLETLRRVGTDFDDGVDFKKYREQLTDNALWIIEARSDTVENDIDTLLREVRRRQDLVRSGSVVSS